jgi:hypothetical protein
MSSMKLTRTFGLVICLAALVFAAGRLDASAPIQAAQTAAAQPAVPVAKLVAEPATVSMRAGESVAVKITAYDAAGNVIPAATVRVNLPRTAGTYADGKITAFAAGKVVATAVAAGAMGAPPVTLEIPVTIAWPALARMEIGVEPGRLYTGLTLVHWATGSHAEKPRRERCAAAQSPLPQAESRYHQRQRGDSRAESINRFDRPIFRSWGHYSGFRIRR